MTPAIRICASSELIDGGQGIGFPLKEGRREASGFVVRHGGQVRGYLNRCAHVPIELDWIPGAFFDTDKSFLMCATHGALYHPETGRCAGGPCSGRGLQPIAVSEQDQQVYWHPDEFFQPPNSPDAA